MESKFRREFTNDFSKFKVNIESLSESNKKVKDLYEKCFIPLSSIGKQFFEIEFKTIKRGFQKTENKLDFLKYHLKTYYLEPEILEYFPTWETKFPFLNIGYSHGLTATDFTIWDIIDPQKNLNQCRLLLIPISDFNTIRFNKFPISEHEIINSLNLYCSNMRDIAKGYSNYLLATEIQKLLNYLENNKEPENREETEIKEDEKNELIGLGYKPPTEKSVLTVSQTALLIDYLQENKIILTSHLGKSKTAKIFSILTNHSNNTLRPKLLGSEITKLKEQSKNGQKEQFGNLKKLKEVLQNIVSVIDKEIENKEKL